MAMMKTWVCQQPGELTWQSRDIPKPQQHEVLIKVKTVGIWEQIFMRGEGNNLFSATLAY